MSECPCGQTGVTGQPLEYAQCCGRYVDHFDTVAAPDAETLMRSRYSAFVLQRADYLLATWHAARRPSRVSLDSDAKWLGLEVRDHVPLSADHAVVEFVARQRDRSGRAVRLHERSRFMREPDGPHLRWYYVDGDWQ